MHAWHRLDIEHNVLKMWFVISVSDIVTFAKVSCHPEWFSSKVMIKDIFCKLVDNVKWLHTSHIQTTQDIQRIVQGIHERYCLMDLKIEQWANLASLSGLYAASFCQQRWNPAFNYDERQLSMLSIILNITIQAALDFDLTCVWIQSHLSLFQRHILVVFVVCFFTEKWNWSSGVYFHVNKSTMNFNSCIYWWTFVIFRANCKYLIFSKWILSRRNIWDSSNAWSSTGARGWT